MLTNTLLLNRSMGLATPESHINWAVERLCEGVDSPSLRILAGLNVLLERDEIEEYFTKTCKELNIDSLLKLAEPRKIAYLVKKNYDLEEMSVEAALYMMAELYQKSEYSDPLLSVWYELEEELLAREDGNGGYFYPPDAIDSLENVFKREWALFERGLRLDLPEAFIRFIQCD